MKTLALKVDQGQVPAVARTIPLVWEDLINILLTKLNFAEEELASQGERYRRRNLHRSKFIWPDLKPVYITFQLWNVGHGVINRNVHSRFYKLDLQLY